MATSSSHNAHDAHSSLSDPVAEQPANQQTNPFFSEEVYDQFGDPEPPSSDASEEFMVLYKQQVESYAKEMLAAFQETKLNGKDLWVEFTATFRTESIAYIPKSTTLRWIEFLIERGVYVKRQQGYPRARALATCLTQPTFVPAETHADGATPTARSPEVEDNHVPRAVNPNSDTRGNQTDNLVQRSAAPKETNQHVVVHYQPSKPNIDMIDISHSNAAKSRTRVEDVLPNIVANSSHNQRQGTENRNPLEDQYRSLGMNGIMKAFQGRDRYGGGFDEDLRGSLEFYDTMARICKLNDHEKVEAMPMMLREDALSFYLNTYRVGMSYEDMLQKLIDNYISDEQRNRTLNLWQSLRLSQFMRENPEKSELDVFRSFCHKLSQLQKQLDPAYRTDNFLRDQMIVAVDTNQITQSLRERIPATSQDARSRIATFLSSEPRSAGAFALSSSKSSGAPHETNYSLGNRYGGDARRNFRGYTKRNRPNHGRISSRSIKGNKKCYVCGEDHLARTRHSPAEVKAAIERMRKRSPSAYVSVEDMAYVVDQLTEEQDTMKEEPGEVNYAYSSDDDSDDDENGTWYIEEDEMSVHQHEEVFLANASFLHGTSFSKDLDEALTTMSNELGIGECARFQGILLDTCANRSSVMSYSQYKAYCEEFQVPCRLEQDDKRCLSGIGGAKASVGTATIPIPFKDLNLVIDVKFQILPGNVPSLLSMKDMMDNGLDISIQNKQITYKHLIQQLGFKNYFLIHKWKPGDLAYALYTETELRKLHRVFGHPSVHAFTNLLRRARPEEMTKEVRASIEELTKTCLTCTVHSPSPRRFKITIGTDDLRFNHIVAIDIMYINQKPVLHAVDEATHYGAALFLRKLTSSDVWKALLRCWSRMYLGPPDFLRVDQGSNFVSKELLDLAETDGISVMQAPIESPTTMSHVERYHGPLRMAYLKIRETMSRSESDADCLQMAIKSINDTVGPEGLCPTLLVFGTIPRPARRSPAETQVERANAIAAAKAAVQKEHAKRRIAFGLRHTGGPKGKEHSSELMKLPSGSPVFVFRDTTKRWEGPFSFIQIEGETVVVQLPHGRKIFRSHVVKPAIDSKLSLPHTPIIESENSRENTSNISPAVTQDNIEAPSSLKATEMASEVNNTEVSDVLLTAMFGTPTTVEDIADNTEERQFEQSRQKELALLKKRKTFKVVDINDVPQGVRIFGSRWVDLIKTVDGRTFEKSRLVAQNFRDKGALHIATKSPTVSRLGQRVAMVIAALLPDHKPYVRDISQAYIQSESTIERNIYLRPPPEMKLEKNQILLVLRPLYGIPESGLHWFITYHNHHKDKLRMTPTKADICLLCRRDGRIPNGVVALQVDDSFGVGDDQFLKDEESECVRFQTFQSKPRKLLENGTSADFNGLTISRRSGSVILNHQEKKLCSVKEAMNAEDFTSTRAQIQYIACCTRPDLCASVQLLASACPNPEPRDYNSLNKVVKRCTTTSAIGLTFIPLDMDHMRLSLFTDASFANGKNLNSQIGFVLALVDQSGHANIIHYGSTQ